MSKMIEDLKKPELARAYWMRTSEEQSILFKAGPEETLIVDCDNRYGRKHYIELSEWREHMVILKPGYEPGPEYLDIPFIIDECGEMALKENCPNSQYRLPWWAAADKDFVEFRTATVPVEITTIAGCVPTWFREGKGPYARFVRATQ